MMVKIEIITLLILRDSVQHRRVLITGLQHVGMTWGAAYFWGALLTKHNLDPQQVWSTPQSKHLALLST